MHEIGLCENVVRAVEARAGGRRVAAFHLRVGVLHRVTPAALRQAFAMVSPGTVAEGAEVTVDEVPLDVTCGDCGARSVAGDPLTMCPTCESLDVQVSGGDELSLVRLQYVDDA